MSVPKLRGRPGAGAGGTALAALLHADRFRLGRDSARVAQNLVLHGGIADERAAAWIGADLPPHGAPSVTLGTARGTLGPHSFGFLDNTRESGPAPFAAPLPARPRRGSIAIVCGRRDALPDVGPLAVARGLGVSWIISAGDGSVEELLAFLATDEATCAVMLAASAGARPGCIAALAGKPAIVLGGDPLLRAAARRAGGADAADLEAWFAHGALWEAGVPAPTRPVALVVGGGALWVEQAARAAGLSLPVRTTSDDDPEEVERALAAAAAEGDLLIVAAGEPLSRPTPATIFVDPGHLDRLRAILAAIGEKRVPAAHAVPPAFKAEQALARAILDQAGEALSDHDTKRLLKVYGVRVSRQAPANSPTAALRIAAQVGYPVDVAAGRVPGAHPSLGEDLRHAASGPDVRRAAALLLDEAPFVLVREWFPPAPRARLSVRREKGLGAYVLVVGVREERALVPLDGADAGLLARAAGAESESATAELLARIAAAAEECALTIEVELYVGSQPAVVAAASAQIRK